MNEQGKFYLEIGKIVYISYIFLKKVVNGILVAKIN